MATITEPILLDSTGQAIKNSIDLLTANINRTADNIAYDSNLTIKGKIQEIDLTSGGDINGNLRIDGKDGTAQTVGSSILRIGNNTPSGTEGNSAGEIRLYSSTSNFVRLFPDSMTANRSLKIPDKGGIIGLQDSVTVLASSTGSKTYAQHIAVLKNVWDTLSIDMKMKCKIRRMGNMIYNCVDTTNGRFVLTLIDSQKVYIEMIRMSNTQFTYLQGTDYYDISNQTTGGEMILYLPL